MRVCTDSSPATHTRRHEHLHAVRAPATVVTVIDYFVLPFPSARAAILSSPLTVFEWRVPRSVGESG